MSGERRSPTPPASNDGPVEEEPAEEATEEPASETTKESSEEEPAGRPEMRNRVRFGIAPGSYDNEEPGVVVGEVFEDTPAFEAGVKPGDRIVTWEAAWHSVLSRYQGNR